MSNELTILMEAFRKADSYRKRHATNRYPSEFKQAVLTAKSQEITLGQIHKATRVSIATL